LDIVVITAGDPGPLFKRSLRFPAERLPVPAEVVVLSREEWEKLAGTRFRTHIEQEAVWVYRRAKG